MNTAAPSPDPDAVWGRVLRIQRKLHRWATEDRSRRFDDLFNLVCDPATLLAAWSRVRGNKGARTAGVDGRTVSKIEGGQLVEVYLDELRALLKSGEFQPVPVRERLIPKRNGKMRRLGIPTIADRVVQAALKIVLEPIFEADFEPCSYGFRPNRRAHDAIAEIHHFATNRYEWVLEGDIEACFDEIDHTALMGRVRQRVGDKRVLRLIKAFLKPGILSEDQVTRDTRAGTPQGGILSPLLANIALSVLDEHFARLWQTTGRTWAARDWHRRRGGATFRLIRYADDFVVMINGSRHHAEELLDEVATVLGGGRSALVTGQDLHRSHRRGVRLPQLPHPAAPQEGDGQAVRLHLSEQTVDAGGATEGQGDQPTEHRALTRRTAHSAELADEGVGELLPALGRFGEPELPGLLHVASGLAMDSPKAPPSPLEAAQAPLSRQSGRCDLVAGARRGAAVQPGEGGDRPLPIPGSPHPEPVE